MKTEVKQGQILPLNTKRQWKLHQQLGELASNLNRLPDAAAVQENKAQCAPLHLLPMVF